MQYSQKEEEKAEIPLEHSLNAQAYERKSAGSLSFGVKEHC